MELVSNISTDYKVIFPLGISVHAPSWLSFFLVYILNRRQMLMIDRNTTMYFSSFQKYLSCSANSIRLKIILRYVNTSHVFLNLNPIWLSFNRIGGVMVRRDLLECGRSWVRVRIGSNQSYRASTIKIQLRVLIQYKADLILISLKINLFSP